MSRRRGRRQTEGNRCRKVGRMKEQMMKRLIKKKAKPGREERKGMTQGKMSCRIIRTRGRNNGTHEGEREV